jgi:RNase P subunit RPR2
MDRKWRCAGCKTLLGIEQAGKLFLRYKQAQYIVVGDVIAICRTCGLANNYNVTTRALPAKCGERASSLKS